MKDQKERYRQAKEELKRVQEDFRSLRDRLKVMKSSYVLLRSTGLQRFFLKLTHSRWILFNVTFPRFVCAHLSNLIWWIFSQLLRPTSIVLPLGNKVIWEISYEIYISWCFDPIQLYINTWLIIFFHERVFNLYLWNGIHYSVVCKSYSLFSIKTYQIPFQYSILRIEESLIYFIHILIWLSLTIQPIFPRDLRELWIVISFYVWPLAIRVVSRENCS